MSVIHAISVVLVRYLIDQRLLAEPTGDFTRGGNRYPEDRLSHIEGDHQQLDLKQEQPAIDCARKAARVEGKERWRDHHDSFIGHPNGLRVAAQLSFDFAEEITTRKRGQSH